MKRTGLILMFSIQSCLVFGQMVLTTKRNDFKPIECFLKLSDSLEAGIAPTSASWAEYFSIPVVQLFSHAPGFDSLKLVSDMKLVFSKRWPSNDTVELDEQQRLILAYRQNKALIRKTIEQIKTQEIDDSIKLLLYPYLPKALQVDSLLPKEIYLFLDEGNGGFPGYVFNSMLQTALVNDFKAGVISAHESYHSIVGGVSMNLLENAGSIAFNNGEKELLSFLESIAEEGIADLIDKPILGRTGSPLYTEVAGLRQNEEQFSIFYLKKIDSLLSVISHTATIPSFDFREFTKNGGHIPGRYMAERIKKAQLLGPCVQAAGDPITFFEQYQLSVKSGNGQALSASSMAYLKSLKARYRK